MTNDERWEFFMGLLSARAKNSLAAEGIDSYEKLTRLSSRELLNTPNIDKSTVAELNAA